MFSQLSGNFGSGSFALQGRNGCGKTTLLLMLAGALQPDSGCILVNGMDLPHNPMLAKMQLGYAPAESTVYPFISGRDFLDFVARAKKRQSVDEATLQLARELSVTEHMATKFEHMSLGTQKKFLLLAATVGSPKVLLLDEPSNGLDQDARKAFADWVRRVSRESLVLMATHDAAFIAECDAQVVEWSALTS